MATANKLIEGLLPKGTDQARKREMMGYKMKWAKTGLLEGLNEPDALGMAQLLETQAKQLVTEANRTSTAAGSEEWAGIALPLIRRIFGEITAKEFVSVQPMNMPSGLVFWLEFKYATGQPGFDTNSGNTSQQDSIWGVSDARKGTPATGGLYGAGRFGYTINDVSSSAIKIIANANGAAVAAGSGSVIAANLTTDVNFDSDFSASIAAADPDQLFKVTIPVGKTGDPVFNLNHPDMLGARAFTLSGTGIVDIFNQFTTVNADHTQVTFLVSGSDAFGSGGATDAIAYYHKQPDDITRGDFEEGKTQEEPLDIPELDLQFHQESITAKGRKLKAKWTPEFAQDINAYQSIDAEAELTSVLGEYIAREIDLEILDMLIQSAQTTDYWSARLGWEYNSVTKTFVQLSQNIAAYTQGTWFQTIGTKIQKMSNEIEVLTQRGGANFIVTSPRVATILESIPGYAADTDGTKAKFNMGSQKMGMINNRFTVYKCPYVRENIMLMGFRGSSYLETGAVYAPYIPLIMTPTVLDPDNFTPRKGVMTRYAKKLLRPEFYGKLYIEGLNFI